MMKSTNLLYAPTSVLPAIAAALALSSTPLLAQEVPQAQPTATEPTTTTPSTTAPAPDEPATSTTESSSPAPAPESTVRTSSTTPRTVHHSVHAAAPKATAVPKVATRTATTHIAAAAPAPAAVPAATNSHVNPVVDLSPQPPAKTAATAKPAKNNDPILPIAGGALAFLAIGGAAVAMTRRREDDGNIDEEAVEQEPVAAAPEPVVHEEQPAIVAPSAFAWGRAEAPRMQPEQSDRKPGETWVERAYRGPSADNPSLSLRARLKRAAFFDKREREVAAGVAEPVDTDAGLPEAMTDEQERELV